MAGRAHETSRPRLQDTAGAGCRFRHRHVDIDVRQGRRGFLCLVAGEHHAVHGRQSVLLLYGALRRSRHQAFIGRHQQQRGDQHVPAADRGGALRLRLLHHPSVCPSRKADAAVGADATGHVFLCDRHGIHADRDIANAAIDGVPRTSRLRARCRALHNSSLQRHRQRYRRCAIPLDRARSSPGSRRC